MSSSVPVHILKPGKSTKLHHSFVLINGTAEINQESVLNDLLKWTIKIARIHLGQDDAKPTVRRISSPLNFLSR